MLKTGYKFGEVHSLAAQAVGNADAVDFKGIFENGNGGVSLLAFKKLQSLTEHVAPAEVMVYVIEGEVEFTMLDKAQNIKAGEFMLMGAGVPHSVIAREDSKVMLIKVKSDL